MKLGDNVSWSELIPPFHKEFPIEQILVDSIVPHTNPVDLVLYCHVQDGWKLGRMLVHLKPGNQITNGPKENTVTALLQLHCLLKQCLHIQQKTPSVQWCPSSLLLLFLPEQEELLISRNLLSSTPLILSHTQLT